MYQATNKDLYASVRGVTMTGGTVTSTPTFIDDTSESTKVPPVHLELEALFKSLIQLNEVIEELSKRLIPVSEQRPAKDEPQRSQPEKVCSIARQIADARMSVQDKTTAILQMMDALQI